MNESFYVRDKASCYGISLKIKEVRCSRHRMMTYHWMFERDGKRILNYWPGNGTWFIDGEKGKVSDAWEALDLAMSRVGSASVIA